MGLVDAIILGIIQGLAEFLPISSSGHLVIVNHLLGIKDVDVFFNISVHIGTLAAIFIVFRKDILNIIQSIFKIFEKDKDFETKTNIKLGFLIIVGSIPTAFIGLFLSKHVDTIFSSIELTGAMLIVTGVIVGSSYFIKEKDNKETLFSFKTAVIIGISQGLAIIPGISRSGSTIVTGQIMGVNRELAGKYSFLLSIPAIVGAEILELYKQGLSLDIFTTEIIVGTLVSFVTGYFVLKYFMIIIKKGKFYLFAPYCFAAGALVFLIR
ncbi:MAG: undecaprenyl-diphosphatase UppP [Desulfobacterales bacterium]|nr:undecaprenyl-diphosphatase UppP [Desulfobacterales bacterium]MCP4160235.1 undecaprenyl-diphosphatase UppP [Deltaproteobacteria bacterium]